MLNCSIYSVELLQMAGYILGQKLVGIQKGTGLINGCGLLEEIMVVQDEKEYLFLSL